MKSMKQNFSFLTILIVLCFLPIDVLGANDQIDTTFGNKGVVITLFGNQNWANSVAIQSDGKIVVAGSTERPSGNTDFLLIRYLSQGTLDSSFGNNGIVTIDFDSSVGASCICIQTDGKIVVAGGSLQNIALARYNSNGTLDESFGQSGKIITDANIHGYANTIALQADTNILIGGNLYTGSGSDFALLRFKKSGILDSSFGKNGVTTSHISNQSSEICKIAISKEGAIFAAGRAHTLDDKWMFGIVKYDKNGKIDTTYGTQGVVLMNIATGTKDFANAAALTADDKIYVAGISINSYTSQQFALVRLNQKGNSDTSFGRFGIVTNDFGSANSEAYSTCLQRDGKIIVAGSKDGNFALTRYDSTGVIDTFFGVKGNIIPEFIAPAVYALAVQPDGKIIAVGSYGDRIVIVRYLQNNQYDTKILSSDNHLFRNTIKTNLQYSLTNSNTVFFDLLGRIQSNNKHFSSGIFLMREKFVLPTNEKHLFVK